MSSRLLALFLVFVLSWSGATAHESLLIGMPGGTPDAGSVADHHLDDLPAQALADAALDAPALPASTPQLPSPALLPAPPAPHRPPACTAAPPGGPHRPPRAALAL